jgi:chemotaxis protein MotB
MSDDTQQPIVVKKIKKGGGGAHGGAWKIAYADFVTAMMAFFLLMWLLGSTAQGDLQGIAEFFNSPLKVAMSGGSGAGDATSPMAGGGQDLTRSVGQVKRGDVEGKRSLNLEAAKGLSGLPVTRAGRMSRRRREERKERARLEDLKGQIEAIIEASPSLRPFKSQLLLDITTEGLRIQIVDEQNRPMFESSSASLALYPGVAAFHRRNPERRRQHHQPVGAYRSTRYAGGSVAFELGALRQSRQRFPARAGGRGLAEGKMVRVVGLAETLPLDPANPNLPINRRISIIVLNKQAEAAMRGDSKKLEVSAGNELEASDIRAGLKSGARPAGVGH